MLYSFVIVGNCSVWEIDSDMYAYHAVDFSMGFCTKILPGAIYNFLFDELSYSKVAFYETVIIIILFVVISVLLEKVMLKMDLEHRKTGLILIFFFLTGPLTFSIYVYGLGILDVYWIVASVLFFILLSKKQLNIFIVFIFLFAIMIHYAAMICFVPFFAVIMIYKLSCTTDKKKKRMIAASLVISVISSVALFAYFMMYETENLTYTLEEFREILKSKGVDSTYFYEFALYRYTAGAEAEYGIISVDTSEGMTILTLIKVLFQQIQIHMELFDISADLVIIFLMIPTVVFILSILGHMFKSEKENKLKKFSFLCMIMLFFATLICSVFMSTDHVRWMSHAFLPLFSSLLYVLYSEGKEAWRYVDKQVSRIPIKLLISYFLVYATNNYHPYY